MQQPAFNAKDVFTMKKFLSGYVNQNRFFRKKTESKTDQIETFIDPPLPPIIVKLDRHLENVNYKYKSGPMVEKKRLNARKVSLPVLKYSPSENKLQLQMIKNLIEQQTSRVVVKDEMLKHMIGYSKLSSVL